GTLVRRVGRRLAAALAGRWGAFAAYVVPAAASRLASAGGHARARLRRARAELAGAGAGAGPTLRRRAAVAVRPAVLAPVRGGARELPRPAAGLRRGGRAAARGPRGPGGRQVGGGAAARRELPPRPAP